MGLIGTVARTAVIAGTATAVSNRVSRRQAGRWAAQGQQAVPMSAPPAQAYAAPPPNQGYAAPAPAYQPPPPPPPAPPAVDTTLEQLRQLADLKTQGILTDAEFDQQKARILGS